MSTNHLGHFVLTQTLLPALKKAALLEDSDVRIINVSRRSGTLSPMVKPCRSIKVSSDALSFAPGDVKLDSVDDLNEPKGEGYFAGFSRYG
jgi:NAD(P)-dependent dehydrogenase (short-subunit alcohol dehydrogenase family)